VLIALGVGFCFFGAVEIGLAVATLAAVATLLDASEGPSF
jgi:hypothetical protein